MRVEYRRAQLIKGLLGGLCGGLLASVLVMSSLPAGAAGSGGSMGGGGGGDVGAAPSPRDLARNAHNEGLKAKRRALRMEEEAAAAANDTDKQAALAQASQNWMQAIIAYRQATQLDPKQHKALNELGYALRKTGNYTQALEAYNAALAMKPEFGEAIEYRAEAYLALGQLDQVKADYMRLVEVDDDIAEQLLAALQAWSKAHSTDSSESVAAFRAWIAERAALAGFVGGVARDWNS